MYGTVSHGPQLRAIVVKHVCINLQRFGIYSMMLCGNIYRNVIEYYAQMFLHNIYATYHENHAASEIYPYNLVVYRNDNVILQPDE